MAFDFKKEYKEYYMPKDKPSIITVPKMNYIAVRGQGDPNAEDGEYKQSIGLLYGVAYTIKMSKKGDRKIDGFYDFVVPPLEGFWWQDGIEGIDYDRKESFHWISVIRLPDFVTEEEFRWAVEEAARKKGSGADGEDGDVGGDAAGGDVGGGAAGGSGASAGMPGFSDVELFSYDEGLCVQCMHIGPYDDEPETVEQMHRFMEEQGYVVDITESRMHHEIYLSDARRVAPEKLKTVVRHPIREK